MCGPDAKNAILAAYAIGVVFGKHLDGKGEHAGKPRYDCGNSRHGTRDYTVQATVINIKDKPFFIYVSHYAPHWPLQAKEEHIAPYRKLYENHDRKTLMEKRLQRQIATGMIPAGTTLHDSMVNAKPAAGGYLAIERLAIHAAMVESIDRSLADTTAALEKAGKRDNTLILVLSDNGASHQMAFDFNEHYHCTPQQFREQFSL